MTTLNATPAELPRDPGSPPRPHWNRIPVALTLAALWVWAILGCVDEWRDNPMYSYGWFVPPLMLFFAWRRLDEPLSGRAILGDSQLPRSRLPMAVGAVVLALFVLPGELLRNELPDDRLNNWCLAIVAILATLRVLHWIGGWPLVRTMAFPVAFFLTGVAWPKRYENPVTLGLQGFVADFCVEVMHILGIHADPHGNSIYLRNGPVGIAEACSGVRSMQASLMISLAVGELFYLRSTRRVVLVGLSALVAGLLNLGRTLSLCLITEFKGADAMHKAHDPIGNAIILLLPVAVWLLGRALTAGDGAHPTDPLPRKAGPDGTPPPPSNVQRLVGRLRTLPWGRTPNLVPALAVGLIGFATYHVWLEVLDRRDPPQRAPYFTAITGPENGVEKIETNPDVWTALGPTSGGSYVAKSGGAATLRIGLSHFFWKPAAANRWVTSHRPDICMPAGGWTREAEPEPLEIEIDGTRHRFTLFRFRGPTQRAVQIWGIWRNGQPIQMEFFSRPVLEWSVLTGKNRSAVETVSCVVTYMGEKAPIDLARQVLSSAFRYQRETGGRAGPVASPGSRP